MNNNIHVAYLREDNGSLSVLAVASGVENVYRLQIKHKVVCKEAMKKGGSAGALFTIPQELINDFFNALKPVVDDIVNKTKPNQEV